MHIGTIIFKIENKQAIVGVIGLGYVGLPLTLCFVEKGFRTIGLDIDQSKVDALHAGRSDIKHISKERIQEPKKTGLCDSTINFSNLPECNA